MEIIQIIRFIRNILKRNKSMSSRKFDEKLLKIMACPLCKTDLRYDNKNQKLICVKCKRKYPIRDGIPVMLIEEAEK